MIKSCKSCNSSGTVPQGSFISLFTAQKHSLTDDSQGVSLFKSTYQEIVCPHWTPPVTAADCLK